MFPFQPGSPKLRVLHLTDFHMDKDFIEGSNTDCGEPVCCRIGDGPPGKNVTCNLMFSSTLTTISANSENPAK